MGALKALYGAKTLWSTCICPKLSPKAKNSQILMINCTPFKATVLAKYISIGGPRFTLIWGKFEISVKWNQCELKYGFYGFHRTH